MKRSDSQIVRHFRQRRRQRQDVGCWPWLFLAGGLVSSVCLIALLLLLGVSQGIARPLADVRPKTLLILGVDRRADETGPARSDSLILAGSHSLTGQAALLAIPRDLWVPIPGVGEQRINTALVYGYDAADPTAGPQLARRTVEQRFGRPVDRYLVLDFETFVRLVDVLGGVDVDVPAPITDYEYPTPDYGITTIHFDAGSQVLDGERALIYVRTRHVDDDFGRSQRQQQVIQAMAARLIDPASWVRLPQFYRVLRDGVQTDLTPADWPWLLQFVQAAASGQVQTATLSAEAGYTTPWITPAGAWVLLPNWPAIWDLLNQLFGP